MKRFRWWIIATILLLTAASTTAFCLPAEACTTIRSVQPSVTVGDSLCLDIKQDLDLGNNGSLLREGTLVLKVVANRGWELIVSGAELKNEVDTIIPSVRFTYTSTATGTDGQGREEERFDSANQVWTGGTPTSNGEVTVAYRLNIPGDQAPGTYETTHTYSLTPG